MFDGNITIPFIRMAAGPMSLGTRAHQVAMYVIYEAPLQMLCESPSRYYEEQETVDFIVQIPTTWDETIVLHGSMGDNWYLGAMTDWTPRELELNLSFLKEGTFRMDVFKDGMNADRFAEDYKLQTLEVNKSSKISVQMAAGGGWTAIISKQGIN